MITCDAKTFSCDTTYESLLELCTKEELKQMCSFLALSVPSSLKKNEYVKRFATAVLEAAPKWLDCIPYNELEVLTELLEKAPGVYVAMPEIFHSLCIEDFLLVGVDEESVKNAFVHTLTNDVRAAISPYIFEIKERRLKNGEDYIEKIITGLLNIYGRLSLTDLKKRVSELLTDEQRAKFDLEDYYKRSFMIERYLILTSGFDGDKSETNYVINPNNPDPEWFNAIERENLKRDTPYSLETILAYGEFPYVKPVEKEAIAFYDFMCSGLRKSHAEAHYTFALCWMKLQLDVKFGSILSDIIADSPMEDVNLLNTCVEKFAAYNNVCPKWMLKGHNAKSIGEEFGKHIPSDNPSGLANDMFGDFGHVAPPPFIAAPKVGRNEPCPCGSGKKYKHCCGKGN